jgi:hypothetical protein
MPWTLKRQGALSSLSSHALDAQAPRGLELPELACSSNAAGLPSLGLGEATCLTNSFVSVIPSAVKVFLTPEESLKVKNQLIIERAELKLKSYYKRITRLRPFP